MVSSSNPRNVIGRFEISSQVKYHLHFIQQINVGTKPTSKSHTELYCRCNFEDKRLAVLVYACCSSNGIRVEEGGWVILNHFGSICCVFCITLLGLISQPVKLCKLPYQISDQTPQTLSFSGQPSKISLCSLSSRSKSFPRGSEKQDPLALHLPAPSSTMVRTILGEVS